MVDLLRICQGPEIDAAMFLGMITPRQLELLAQDRALWRVLLVMERAIAHADRDSGSRDVLGRLLARLTEATTLLAQVRATAQRQIIGPATDDAMDAEAICGVLRLIIRCGRALRSRVQMLPLFELISLARRATGNADGARAEQIAEELAESAAAGEALLLGDSAQAGAAAPRPATGQSEERHPRDAVPVIYEHCMECPDVNQFRELPSYPMADELEGPPTFLTQLSPREPIYEFDRHLEAHYRLLREDMVSGLREAAAVAAARFRAARRDAQRCFLLRNVRVSCPTELNRRVGRPYVSLQLDKNDPTVKSTRWEAGRHLGFGSLVALSPGGTFARNDLVWGTVVETDSLRSAHILDVELRPEDFAHPQVSAALTGDTSVRFWLLESPVFFEAYRHTMASLQRLRAGDVPLFFELSGTVEAVEAAMAPVVLPTERVDLAPLYHMSPAGSMMVASRDLTAMGIRPVADGHRCLLDDSAGCVHCTPQPAPCNCAGPPGDGEEFRGSSSRCLHCPFEVRRSRPWAPPAARRDLHEPRSGRLFVVCTGPPPQRRHNRAHGISVAGCFDGCA